jgi:uncharacterized cupredoxin-like copper-binding protein
MGRMTTAIHDNPPDTSSDDPGPPSPDGVTRDDLRALADRIERQARRSTAWAVSATVGALVAVMFSVVAIGWGSRAIADSKHNARLAMASTAPMAETTPPSTAPPAAAGSPIAVRRDEFQVVPSATTIAAGTVTLHITNAGKVSHELLVFRTDLAPTAYPMDGTDLNEEGSGMTKVSDGDNIDPGGSQDRVVDLTQPGSYVFLCNLPDHFKAGMYAIVTVR